MVDTREIGDRAVKVEGWDRLMLALSPEDLLIYLSLHWAVHHAFAGLIWQLDLALLIRRHAPILDWDAVGQRARRWRGRGALYFALRTVHEGLGVQLPSSLLADLRPHGARAAAVAWLLRRRDERLGRLDHAIPLLLRSGIRRPPDCRERGAPGCRVGPLSVRRGVTAPRLLGPLRTAREDLHEDDAGWRRGRGLASYLQRARRPGEVQSYLMKVCLQRTR